VPVSRGGIEVEDKRLNRALRNNRRAVFWVWIPKDPVLSVLGVGLSPLTTLKNQGLDLSQGP
jgi:hypothetical protein